MIVRFFKRRYWNYVVAGTEMWLCSEKDVVNLVFIIKVRILLHLWMDGLPKNLTRSGIVTKNSIIDQIPTTRKLYPR